MTTFKFKYEIGHSVTVTLETKKIRWCNIAAVKFMDGEIRVDVTLPSGNKLYDLNSNLIEGTGEGTDHSELM